MSDIKKKLVLQKKAILQKKVIPYLVSVFLGCTSAGCAKEPEQKVVETPSEKTTIEQVVENNTMEEIVLEEEKVVAVEVPNIQGEEFEVEEPVMVATNENNYEQQQSNTVVNNVQPQQLVLEDENNNEELVQQKNPQPEPTPVVEQQSTENPYLNMTYEQIEELHINDIYKALDLNIYFWGARDGYFKYKKYHPDLPFVDCVLRVNMGLTEPPFPEKGRTIGPVKNFSLVNKYNRISKEIEKLRLEEIETINGEDFKLRNEARIAYEKMREAANNAGINLVITGAFRTKEEQTALYNKALKTKSQAEVDLEIARPDYSENEIGLAVELAITEGSAEYNWLVAHAHEYGFILRYPRGKEEFTQYKFKPGHFRYLGVELATKVKNSGLCYDEYFHKILRPGDISHYMPSNNLEEKEPMKTKENNLEKVLVKSIF
ncbi:MAG: M15 family metallopeptidase [Bacilli bacterium]|nr:M15 family metallopeptidase [Bacilli bacterium]